MGQKMSNSLLQDEVKKSRHVERLLRLIYDKVTVNVFTGTISASPLDVIEDVILGSKYVLIYQENIDGIPGEKTKKVLSYDQFVSLRRKVSEMERLLGAGAHIDSPESGAVSTDDSESECMICMESSIEIVLPCSHSFCLKCFEDWRKQNPTCPCCRKELIPGETDDACWQIENWEQHDVRDRMSELRQDIETLVASLPNATQELFDTHRVLFPTREEEGRTKVGNRDDSHSDGDIDASDRFRSFGDASVSYIRHFAPDESIYELETARENKFMGR